MTDARLTIGAMAERTACTVPTIRYYEQIGLLPRPARAANGHRYYRDCDLKRLHFIKRCRDFGFPIEQVRTMASLFEDGDRACVEVRDLAQVHLDEVRRKLGEMRQLEKSLAGFVSRCHETCLAGSTRDCVIIGDLTSSCGAASCGGPRTGTMAQASGDGITARELKRNRV